MVYACWINYNGNLYNFSINFDCYYMNLFFDTETTGLPQKHHAWDRDYKEYPYILSIAWKYKSKAHYYMIYQEGRIVPPEATKANGITTQMANNKNATLPFQEVYCRFIEDSLDCVNVIGHNVYFDISIFKANVLKQYGVNSKEINKSIVALDKDKRIDTMRETQKLFGKWPKLVQLHEYLFGEEFPNAHDALEDVLALERCYNELKKRKIM